MVFNLEAAERLQVVVGLSKCYSFQATERWPGTKTCKNTHTCSLLFYSLCSELSPKVKGQRQRLLVEWQEGERGSSCVFSHSVTGVLAPPEDMCSPRAPLSSTQSSSLTRFRPSPLHHPLCPPPTPPPLWHRFLQRLPVPSGHLKDRRSGKKVK